MGATEIITVNGLREEVTVQRLSPADAEDALTEFALFRLEDNVTDDEYDAFRNGCSIQYRDDLDMGKSWYQVTDANGHGDGTGTWHPVS